ncbi:hypothetical protein G7A66_03645 [Altererythrobacter sp. SALINAS58]|uniref:hypothetical protein n=1 Tax=Alteripontixanthobacter muriae TaxID=2705546 RepID=UPI00157720A7|nr:hypothetical protein [Alteripontixanthobacter muriae]NTZ42200.1 hypothetical protein [Alteripontixanthobacter muriae]
MDEIFDTIAGKIDTDGAVEITEDEVLMWATERGQTASNFLDSFGFELAKRFHAGERSYAFCDEVVNELWVILTGWMGDHLSEPFPNTFYEIFDAFDAGEYYRRADKSDDPVSQFTKPMIAELIRKSR